MIIRTFQGIGTGPVTRSAASRKRAEYGLKIVHALSAQLVAELGRGFTARNLFNMIRFAEVFSDSQIVQALSAQLGWTHFRQIIGIDDPLKRDFYAEMCRIERWSTRTLQKKIGSMLFERTALSRKPEKLIKQEIDALKTDDKVTPDLVFRDPYFLDFLSLKDSYAEKDPGSGHSPRGAVCRSVGCIGANVAGLGAGPAGAVGSGADAADDRGPESEGVAGGSVAPRFLIRHWVKVPARLDGWRRYPESWAE